MTNREELGRLGEELVANLLGATINEDWYDQQGDMLLNEAIIEVKTQSRHPMGLFTLNTKYLNQIKKCMKVDRLIFVEYDSTKCIKVFECLTQHRKNYVPFTTRDGRRMIGWHISDMKCLASIEDDKLSETMRSLSNSSLFTKA